MSRDSRLLYMRAYNEKRREAQLLYKKEWAEKNRDSRLLYMRAYNEKRREARNEFNAALRQQQERAS